MKETRKNVRVILLFSFALITAGCSPLTVDEEPVQRYRFDAGGLSTEMDWGLPRGLVVAEPELPTVLDTDRITIFFGNRRVDHYADARWSDRVSRLIHTVSMRVIERLHGEAVDPYIERSPEYVIRSLVRDFQAVYPGTAADSPPRLEVGLMLALVETATERTLAEARVNRTAAAAANRTESIIGGLNTLLLEALETALLELNRQVRDKQEM